MGERATQEIRMIPLSLVEPDRDQPRKHFDEEKLLMLADSIRQHGILEPLVARDMGDYYQIIAGERRWRASAMAGLKEVPVIVRDTDDLNSAELSLIENLQREDLNAMERAMAYERLIDTFGMSQSAIARRLSKSPSAVSNSLRLLGLGGQVREMVLDGRLSEGHARALLALPEEKRLAAAELVVKDGLSVRDIERIVYQDGDNAPLARTGGGKAPALRGHDADMAAAENVIRDSIGMKCSIRPRKKGGQVTITYASDDDLERLYDLLTSGHF